MLTQIAESVVQLFGFAESRRVEDLRQAGIFDPTEMWCSWLSYLPARFARRAVGFDRSKTDSIPAMSHGWRS